MSPDAAVIGVLIGIAFIAGAWAGYSWSDSRTKDIQSCAESAASIARGYCAQGESFYGQAASLEGSMLRLRESCDRLADESKVAAEKLDAMDRTQGAMLSALINVGIIGRTGGQAVGRESDFAG